MRRDRIGVDPLLRERQPRHHLHGHLRHRQARCLGDKRHGAACPWIDLDHVERRPAVFFLHRELHVHEPDHAQAPRHTGGGLLDLVDHLHRQAVRRDAAGRVAGVHASLLDVFHHAGDDHLAAVADAVDVDLDRVLEKPVDQHRLPLRHGKGLRHIPLELHVVVADLHSPPAEHEAGANQRREPDPGHLAAGLLQRPRDAAGRLLEPEPVEQFAKLLPILRHLDRVDTGADDRQAGGKERPGEVQRRLSTKLHDYAVGLDAVGDVEHVLAGERLEEEHVARVVVGTHGLGVRVDHHALDPHLTEREARVAAAIVELDALPDPVGATTKDHHAFPAWLFRPGFVLVLPRGVVVGRLGLELGGTGVDRLVGGEDPSTFAILTNLHL